MCLYIQLVMDAILVSSAPFSRHEGAAPNAKQGAQYRCWREVKRSLLCILGAPNTSEATKRRETRHYRQSHAKGLHNLNFARAEHWQTQGNNERARDIHYEIRVYEP